MKLQDIYETAYNEGIAADPRGREGVERVLERARKAFADLPENKQWEFDQETLVNPYADTRILVGDPDTEISTMLVGIDLEVGRSCWPTLSAPEGPRSICCSPIIPKAEPWRAWNK